MKKWAWRIQHCRGRGEMQGAGKWRVNHLIPHHHRRSLRCPGHTHLEALCDKHLKLYLEGFSTAAPYSCVANDNAIWKWQGVPPRKKSLMWPTSSPLRWEVSESKPTQSTRGAQQDWTPVAYNGHLLIKVLNWPLFLSHLSPPNASSGSPPS